MNAKIYELNSISAAQYWEAQADMWHENYKDMLPIELQRDVYAEALEKISKCTDADECRRIAITALNSIDSNGPIESK